MAWYAVSEILAIIEAEDYTTLSFENILPETSLFQTLSFRNLTINWIDSQYKNKGWVVLGFASNDSDQEAKND